MILPRWRCPKYNPKNDNELFFWLDANDTSTLKGSGGSSITNGATVYEWLNKGSSSAKFVQSGSFNRPTWSREAYLDRPGVMFNGSQILGADVKTGFDGLSGITIMMACLQTVTPGQHGGRAFHIAGSGAIRPVMFVTLRNDMLVYVGGRRELLNTHTDVGMQSGINKPIIATGAFDYSNAILYGYLDGVFRGTRDPFQTKGTISWGTLYSITVGAQHDGDGTMYWPFTGPIFEMFLWRRLLTAEELIGPHYYLARKWRISPDRIL